jgi:hypothetical protein
VSIVVACCTDSVGKKMGGQVRRETSTMMNDDEGKVLWSLWSCGTWDLGHTRHPTPMRNNFPRHSLSFAAIF